MIIIVIIIIIITIFIFRNDMPRRLLQFKNIVIFMGLAVREPTYCIFE